jgi:hypothetical protein
MRFELPSVTFTLEPVSGRDEPDDLGAYAPGTRFHARMHVLNGDSKRLLWEVECDGSDPKATVKADVEKQAAGLGTQFACVVAGLTQELKLTEDQAIGLAVALTFPLILVGAKARLMDARPKQRGRPRHIDPTTKKVGTLAAAWLRATGRHPGTAARAEFVRALDAVKDFLPLRRRDGGAIDDMSQFLRAELAKLGAEDVEVLVPQNSLADDRMPMRTAN